MPKFETHDHTAPACWAPYLFNDDPSGIEDADVAAADAMIQDIGLGSPTGCSDDEFFCPYPDYSTRDEDGRRLGCTARTYTFLKKLED